jgi:hypothetical protein
MTDDAPATVEVPPVDDVEAGKEEWERSADLGVDTFGGKSEADLQGLLGWRNPRPPIFADLRSQRGISEWDDGVEFEQDDPDLEPLKLLWHQTCGIATIVNMLFVDKEQSKMPGILLADKVGLGKTAQVMGTIAFLIQVWMQEKATDTGNAAARPPLICE